MCNQVAQPLVKKGSLEEYGLRTGADRTHCRCGDLQRGVTVRSLLAGEKEESKYVSRSGPLAAPCQGLPRAKLVSYRFAGLVWQEKARVLGIRRELQVMNLLLAWVGVGSSVLP